MWIQVEWFNPHFVRIVSKQSTLWHRIKKKIREAFLDNLNWLKWNQKCMLHSLRKGERKCRTGKIFRSIRLLWLKRNVLLNTRAVNRTSTSTYNATFIQYISIFHVYNSLAVLQFFYFHLFETMLFGHFIAIHYHKMNLQF